MTITRTRIRCRERACPWPFDEEFHEVPWCRGIKEHECFGGVEHQHWPKRSQGGKEIVALLCSGAHDRIDNRDWGNAVKEINGKRVYFIWDLHGEILYERVLGVAATGEGEAPGILVREARSVLPSPAAPAPSDGGEGRIAGYARASSVEASPSPPSPGAPEQAGRTSGPDYGGQPSRIQVVTPATTPPSFSFQDNGIEWEPEFTFDDWARAAERVKTESVGRQWRVGDLVNAERWAECSQFYDDLGYPPETQANYGRVAAAYKLAERRPLSFGHHQAVYKHELRLALLDAAVENGWDRAELRKQAGYEKRSGLRRFTIEELRERAGAFRCNEYRNHGRNYLFAYLDGLEEQE